MKKTNKIIFAAVALVLIILAAVGIYFINNKNQQKSPAEVVLPIDNLKLNDEYVYDGIKWGTALKEVEKKLPFMIEKLDLMGTTAPAETKLVDNRTETKLVLDGQSTYSATFKFQDDKFVMASFFFSITENYEEWYNVQIEKLIDLYGEESQIAKNKSDSLDVTVYRWDTEMTSLQFTSMVKEDGSATVSLTVFYRYQG